MSRFDKYENDSTKGASASNHIANIHNFIDWLYEDGNDIIEKEIADLSNRIAGGNAPAIFGNKKMKLIKLGKDIEDVYETYHFNKDN